MNGLQMTAAEVLRVLEASQGSEGYACYDEAGAPCSSARWCAAVGLVAFADLTFDSRAVRGATLFVCKGAAFKESYIKDAVSRGAVAYLAPEVHDAGIPGLVVRDVRRAMAFLACAFFDNPSHRLRVVGTTGTKGKTTVTYYLDAILRARGAAPNAMLTGLVIDDGMRRVPSQNTTPEAIELQRHLAHAVQAGCDTAVMEVSSQALKYDRTLGTRFAVGLFTNIGEDHISAIEHPTFEDYFASKLALFDQCSCAVVNLQADHASRILDRARAAAARVLTYSTLASSTADIRLLGAERLGEGVWGLSISVPDGLLRVDFRALGFFNVSNALAAVSAAYALGVPHEAIEKGLSGGVRVPGRMERYDAPDGSVVGIVDYAHNEMSMGALLRCAREEFPGREITVVFGATGDRGTHRRAGLGRAAGRYADRVILTEDDPGPASVADICAEIGAAVRREGKDYEVVENRPDAVRHALKNARRPAVVLLAGKGAERCIHRARGIEACASDAELLCRELGIEFGGYDGLP